MRVIKDLKGREWELQITVGTVKRVRSYCDLDLYNIGDSGFIKIIIDEPIKLIEMFWTIFEDQAKAKEIDEKEFCEGWAGDIIDEATKIFLDELIEFFPEKKRQPARKLLEKLEALAIKAYSRVEAECDSLSEEDMNVALDTATENMKQK